MKTVFLDGEKIADRRALHDAFGAAVSFPAGYGYNLDALHDVLTDRCEPLTVIAVNCGSLEAALGDRWPGFLRLMSDLETTMPDFRFISEAGGNPIFRRVSVRKFLPDPVPESKVEKLLRAAMAAPSAGNQQPWEFFVVTDAAKIRELAGCSPYSSCAANAPLLVVPCARTQGLRFPEYNYIDLANATENLLLEATHLGLGAVWLACAPDPGRMSRVAAVLGTNETLLPFALVPVGLPAETKAWTDRYDPDRVHRVD